MDKDFYEEFLRETVKDTMNIYKTAFEEGRKIGEREGYIRGLTVAQAIADKLFAQNKKE